jgi:hypothetical protein
MAYEFKPYTESETVKKARENAEKYGTYTESDAVKAARENANKYNTYTEGASVVDSRNALNDYITNNKPGEWTGGNYKSAVENAFNAWNNREKFSYDLNGDALYQQYKDKYINQGRLAMADTIGQASAMTGGYGSSYAVTAGNQAYQSHLQSLNDIVPQLYQMAYDRYVQEGQDLKDSYSMASNMYNTEYGEYRDRVGDYNTEVGRLTDVYNNERAYDRGIYESDRAYATTLYDNERNFDYGQWDANRNYYTDVYNNERNFDYGVHNTNEQNAFNAYQQERNDYYQGENLKIAQAQLKLQQDAANAVEAWEGLSFEESETLMNLYQAEDWESIDKYLASLNLSDADLAALQKLWLPEDWGKPKVEPISLPGDFKDTAKKVIYGNNAGIVEKNTVGNNSSYPWDNHTWGKYGSGNKIDTTTYADPRKNKKNQTFGVN